MRLGALGGASMLGASTWTRRGNAVTFGEIPTSSQSSMLPETLRAQSVLECYLSGGFNPWETFYCRPGLGEVDGTFAYGAYDQLIKASEGCGFEQAGPEPFTRFAKDSAQHDIFFGPYMRRLLARPDVLKRLRVVVTRHRNPMHEYASSLVATGREHGHVAAASLGAHVNRYFVDRESNDRVAPFSYAFVSPAAFTFNSTATFAEMGLHPGRARPARFSLDALGRVQRLWARTTVGTTGERAQYDALLSTYFQQLGARLPENAGSFRDLERAFAKQQEVDALRGVVFENEVVPWMTEPMCQEVATDSSGAPIFVTSAANVPAAAGNLPAMGLRLATHLLTHPTQPARYCCVVDSGIKAADGGGGYDCHANGPWRQAINFNNLMEYLLGFINAPGQADARKLSLDKTLIILNTEFGRSPSLVRQGVLGRDHWPSGFVQIFIGGPIREGQAGCYGHIDEAGVATTFTTPAENRIAALLALGIHPFDGDGLAFAPSDVPGAADSAAAIRAVQQKFFGVAV